MAFRAKSFGRFDTKTYKSLELRIGNTLADKSYSTYTSVLTATFTRINKSSFIRGMHTRIELIDTSVCKGV